METERKNEIRRAIVETIAFFDLFNYPLTSDEIRNYLWKAKADLDEIEEALSGIEEIEKKERFYFLKGREEIINKREERFGFTSRKLKRARLIAKIFKIFPWIKMIAVGNLIGKNNLRDESDIDFFVITEKNRIWITRFFTAALMQVFGLRPKRGKMRDKICLSFYIAEDEINLEKFMMGENDIYFVYWTMGLRRIFGEKGMSKEFYEANAWIKNYLPNFNFSGKHEEEKSLPGIYHGAIDFIFGRSENFLKNFQLRLLPKEIKENMNKDTRVVINDRVLKLHVNDRRGYYKNEWEKICSRIK